MKTKFIESDIVELKSGIPTDLEKEVTAFLNYNKRGSIYIGVNDDGEIIGIDNPDKIQLIIKDRIKNNIEPSPLGLFAIELIPYKTKEYIKISIEPGFDKPYYLKKTGLIPKGTYIRIGSSKEQMTKNMIEKMRISRYPNVLRSMPAPTQKLTFKALKIYYSDSDKSFNEKTFKKNLNFYNEEGKLNYVAYLFSDNCTLPFRVVKYRGTNKLNVEENTDFGNKCILTTVHNVLNRVESENRTYMKKSETKPTRDEIKRYDYLSVKEAVLNAFVHNNYSFGSTPMFEFYDDRFEITSAGSLFGDITEEDFYNGIVARRNEDILKIFKDLDMIEDIGSGIPKILEKYPKKTFIFLHNYIRVSFKYKENTFDYGDGNKIGIESVTKLGTQLGTQSGIESSIESKILEFCIVEQSMSNIMNYLGYSDKNKFIKRHIKPLLKSGKLKMTVPDKPNSRLQKYVTNKEK